METTVHETTYSTASAAARRSTRLLGVYLRSIRATVCRSVSSCSRISNVRLFFATIHGFRAVFNQAMC